MAKHKNPREYAVIGLGRFGASLARTLEEQGNSVLAIDNDPELVQSIADFTTQAATLDATNEDALRVVDISSFETVIVAISEDFEANLLITSALKSLGVKHVISKALTDRQRDILLRIGADRVVQPEQSAGRRLAYELSSPTVLERMPLGQQHSLVELVAPASLTHQSIAQLDVRSRYGVTVVLIHRGDEVIAPPPPDLILQTNDVLFVLGTNEDIAGFCAL